jgi:hypothetical protein
MSTAPLPITIAVNWGNENTPATTPTITITPQNVQLTWGQAVQFKYSSKGTIGSGQTVWVRMSSQSILLAASGQTPAIPALTRLIPGTAKFTAKIQNSSGAIMVQAAGTFVVPNPNPAADTVTFSSSDGKTITAKVTSSTGSTDVQMPQPTAPLCIVSGQPFNLKNTLPAPVTVTLDYLGDDYAMVIPAASSTAPSVATLTSFPQGSVGLAIYTVSSPGYTPLDPEVIILDQ